MTEQNGRNKDPPYTPKWRDCNKCDKCRLCGEKIKCQHCKEVDLNKCEKCMFKFSSCYWQIYNQVLLCKLTLSYDISEMQNIVREYETDYVRKILSELRAVITDTKSKLYLDPTILDCFNLISEKYESLLTEEEKRLATV